MDITKAYEILHKYYSDYELRRLRQKKKFGGSESDSIRELGYYGNLLREKADTVTDEKEKSEIYEAADAFEAAGKKGFCNK